MGVDAERDRLTRALAQGPGRRMAADRAAGRGLDRADVRQAARYRGWLAGLGGNNGVRDGEENLADGGGLGLDRIEGRG